ncbi:type IX secretion system outer membrane channel protein PorV [Mucilaginibacter sp. HMF5004]|uniref:type IX secretion system outer membrane channel protein PorV n=1 Tax=Mucilaginibacter rivuli TaxID=2857527 RepID=UPI001C5DA547|nr:type IX secretion system outer membrane channel protein PorV [Mucilaginibacter rivuli]MBW4889831.1 type IX secretion system outer membrane channel protein PorV [Mucilaginibacter rivuli]
MKQILLSFIFLSVSAISFAQGININGSSQKAITTAVPFLNIGPDARSGGLGEAGVALSPDGNSAFWNPSKLAFVDEPTKISLSYSPWMRRVFPDVNLAYLSFLNKIDDRNTIGASLRYFNLGSVNSYDDNATSLGVLKPNEFSFDVSLARKFTDNFSLGLTARFIHSNLTQGAVVNGQQSQSASAVAADVSLYYSKPKNNGSIAFGANISNIGSKMSYYTDGPQYFLPTNLKIGIARTYDIDEADQITFMLDANKLLVPTPPLRDNSGNITSGRDDNRSVVSGIFGSFSDAPGGFTEEFQEISFSPAFEYWYKKTFAIRAGYFYENPNKGSRQYTTLGAGVKYQSINFDFSYLVASQNVSPLSSVVRLSLGYNFGSVKR